MSFSRLRAAHADYAGILATLICLVHCLVGPLVLGAATHTHGHVHGHEGPWYTHRVWDFVFLAIGLLAVQYSARHSREFWMRGLLWGAFGLLAFSILFEAYHIWIQYLVYIASAILVGTHLLRIRQLSCELPANRQKGHHLAKSSVDQL